MVAPLDIDGVEIRGRALVLASDAEVDSMQDELGVEFPDGYRAYITRLGEGSLNDFVRVLPPWRILAELEEHRGMMAAYWFWESGKVPFGQEQAMESIPIADTMDGDAIAFHPTDRRQIIILPRNDERLYARRLLRTPRQGPAGLTSTSPVEPNYQAAGVGSVSSKTEPLEAVDACQHEPERLTRCEAAVDRLLESAHAR